MATALGEREAAMTFDEVLGRLHGVQHRGARQAQTLCPAHDDRIPSLSVTCADDGRILLRCHAGCTIDDILAAAEWTKADLFPARVDMAKMDIVYDYVDEKGDILFQVVRRPNKQFRQRRPDGKEGWTYKLGDVRRVLYCLPEILGAD